MQAAAAAHTVLFRLGCSMLALQGVPACWSCFKAFACCLCPAGCWGSARICHGCSMPPVCSPAEIAAAPSSALIKSASVPDSWSRPLCGIQRPTPRQIPRVAQGSRVSVAQFDARNIAVGRHRDGTFMCHSSACASEDQGAALSVLPPLSLGPTSAPAMLNSISH